LPTDAFMSAPPQNHRRSKHQHIFRFGRRRSGFRMTAWLDLSHGTIPVTSEYRLHAALGLGTPRAVRQTQAVHGHQSHCWSGEVSGSPESRPLSMSLIPDQGQLWSPVRDVHVLSSRTRQVSNPQNDRRERVRKSSQS
jgi:hypothetical protein